jgi:thioesterase domain-containing protein/acyl carrier protein
LSQERYLDNGETHVVTPTANDSESVQEAFLFPCSIVQRVCWFLDQMSPGTPANNIAVRFQMHGPVSHELVREALREIVRRHEVLRTRFVRKDGEPKQLVEQAVRFELPLEDLRGRPAELRLSEAERLAVEEARIGFNLATGPLFRGRLIQTADEDYTLLLTMHHIVSDGWSVGIVTEELGAIYEALATQTRCSLPALPIQYADYACWQEQWVTSGELDRQLEYWKQKLGAFEPLDIPTDKPRPGTPINRGEIRSIVLPRGLTDALKDVSDRHGCTLFMTMMAAFVALLRHESKRNDIVVRTQTAGRANLDLEPLIGWFVNSIVLRNRITGDPTFETVLKQVQETSLAAFEHQDVPFERLIEIIRPAQPLGRRPPFQVNFIFQRDFVKPWQRGGITFTPIPSKATGTFVDLNFFLVERRDGWRASVDVNVDVFHPETGEFFLRNFQTALETVASDPRRPISQIPFRTRSGIEPKEQTAAVTAGDYVAPRNAMEARVAAIWERVLGIAPVGIFTNFFDLGGHSLLAVRIVTAIESELGQQIKLAQLFVNPTVAAMAQILEGVELPKQDVVLIPVQPNGSRPPLLMVGGDHWFRRLAKRLHPDQPFLGLSLQAYEGRVAPTPFEEIASDLAAKIITVQPEGPYYLSGWCVDGAVAFEVAGQLVAAGRAVGLVVLIDALNPEYRREYNSRASVLDRAVKRTGLLLHEAKDKGLRGAVEYVWEGLCDLGHRTARRLRTRSGELEQDPVIVQADPDRQEFRRLLHRSEALYTPPAISCPVLLLRTVVEPLQDPNLGWAKVSLGGLETVEIPGDHIGMFREPLVEHLASVLSSRLIRAQTAEGANFSKPNTASQGPQTGELLSGKLEV